MGDLHDAGQGGRLNGLRALRDRLAIDIDRCESMRDLAALSLRLVDVLQQIAEIAGPASGTVKETGLSDFEKRLRDRESSAKVPRRSKSG